MTAVAECGGAVTAVAECGEGGRAVTAVAECWGEGREGYRGEMRGQGREKEKL